MSEAREIQLQEQINKAQQAKETLEVIEPWLNQQRAEVYRQLEDKANHDETRLKYHLVALKDLENGLNTDISTGKMAIKEQGE